MSSDLIRMIEETEGWRPSPLGWLDTGGLDHATKERLKVADLCRCGRCNCCLTLTQWQAHQDSLLARRAAP